MQLHNYACAQVSLKLYAKSHTFLRKQVHATYMHNLCLLFGSLCAITLGAPWNVACHLERTYIVWTFTGGIIVASFLPQPDQVVKTLLCCRFLLPFSIFDHIGTNRWSRKELPSSLVPWRVFWESSQRILQGCWRMAGWLVRWTIIFECSTE